MAQRISMVSGVAQVSVFGSQKYAVRVQLDPKALASRQVGIDEVERDCRGQREPAHRHALRGTHQAFTVQANGQLNKAADYRPLIVAYRNGAPVRLEEIGRVFDSVQNDKTASWYQRNRGHRAGHSAPAGHQHGGSGGHHQAVDAAISRRMMPARSTWTAFIDRSVSIRSSVDDVQFTLVAGAGAGGSGDLPFPAEPFGHGDSQPGAADVHRRHVRRDVSAGLFSWTIFRSWR